MVFISENFTFLVSFATRNVFINDKRREISIFYKINRLHLRDKLLHANQPKQVSR